MVPHSRPWLPMELDISTASLGRLPLQMRSRVDYALVNAREIATPFTDVVYNVEQDNETGVSLLEGTVMGSVDRDYEKPGSSFAFR